MRRARSAASEEACAGRNRLKAGSFAERFGHHAAKGENELQQSGAALQLTDNLRPGDAFDSTILGAEDEGGLLVRIAERPDARQQQSIAFRLGEERLAQRARRAAGGQIDGGEGKRQRVWLLSAGHAAARPRARPARASSGTAPKAGWCRGCCPGDKGSGTFALEQWPRPPPTLPACRHASSGRRACTPYSLPLASARSHNRFSEKRPSGASLNSLSSQSETPAKANGTTSPSPRRASRPSGAMAKSPLAP